MLRRPATTIKLTPEDILHYDDSVQLRQKSGLQIDNNQEQEKSQDGILFKEPLQSRNDRMGVSRGER